VSAGRGAALRDGVLLAAGTLTAVRVPPPRLVGPRQARTAMLLAPVVGLLLGAAVALVVPLARVARLGSLPAAVLVLGVLALLTRGLHLDGLADTADGLASGYDRGRALEVMRRGDTGPAGVAALVLVLLVQVAALAQCLGPPGARGPVTLLVAVVAGRTVLPVACARGVPAARASGLGAAVVGTVPRSAAAAVVVGVAVAAAVATGVAGGGRSGGAASAGWPGALAGAGAVLAAVAVAGLLLRRCVVRFGGVSGDVLGASVEAGTTAALVVLATVPLS
jgi:adenosylcobinamide-GDP ribazoletransferase